MSHSQSALTRCTRKTSPPECGILERTRASPNSAKTLTPPKTHVEPEVCTSFTSRATQRTRGTIKPTKESNGAKPPDHTAAFGAMDHHKGTTSTLLYHRQWNRHGTRQHQRFSPQALLCASRSRRLTLRTQLQRPNASYSISL